MTIHGRTARDIEVRRLGRFVPGFQCYEILYSGKFGISIDDRIDEFDMQQSVLHKIQRTGNADVNNREGKEWANYSSECYLKIFIVRTFPENFV